MLNNYQYFLVLAEELNITKAAERLYISHQCLSRYLQNLEKHHQITLFERKPRLTLTPAGECMLRSLKEIQRIEQDMDLQLGTFRDADAGIIRLAIPEGRFRLLAPKLLVQFKVLYPRVQLKLSNIGSHQIHEMLNDNKLDLALLTPEEHKDSFLQYIPVLDEHLYMVISDNLLREHFPDSYPQCKETFAANGANLQDFTKVPFITNHSHLISRRLLDQHLTRTKTNLNIINEFTQIDLFPQLCMGDYAAGFCLSMFVQQALDYNHSTPSDNQLNVFPISGLEETVTLELVHIKSRIFPPYVKELIQLIIRICNENSI